MTEDSQTRAVGPPAALPSDPPEESLHVERGTSVGRYMVLERIGAGGMGIVFSAYDPQLDRKVALKLMRTAPPSGQSATGSQSLGDVRLLREAQALAKLSHPNVVAVHDVGTYEGGIFIAMELIDGATLRGWSDGSNRGWRATLELFRAAGHGLAAAHRAGLVHRDFKPDNVLVGADGRICVMDFGLARAADTPRQPPEPVSPQAQDVSISSTLTQAGSVLGTLAYMAPEQFKDGTCGPAADQFSFCVSLFEALYGVRPFDGTLSVSSPDRWKVFQPDASRSAAVPGWVRRAVLKGLSTDPAERHASMDVLVAELSRNPAARYQRLAAVLAGAVTLVGFAYLSGSFERGRPPACSDGSERLVGVWDERRADAVREAFMRTEVAYAVDAFTHTRATLDTVAREWAATHEESCTATRVRREHPEEVLSLRMACLDGRLLELKSLVDVFTTADAQIVERSTKAASELQEVSRCLDVEALRAAVAPPPDPATASAVDGIRRQVARASALLESGKEADALPIALAAAEAAKRTTYMPVIAEALTTLARIQVLTSDPAARRNIEEALVSAEAAGLHELKARAATLLVSQLFVEADFNSGHLWARYTDASISRLHRSGKLKADLLFQLGTAYSMQNRFEDSREYLNRSLQLCQTVQGPDHPDCAATENSLGVLFDIHGRYDEALVHHRRALDIYSKAFGPLHPTVAISQNNIGAVLEGKGEREQALVHYQAGYEIRLKALPPGHPRLASSLVNLGSAHLSLGNTEKARELYQRAVTLLDGALGLEHPRTANPLTNLGNALAMLGRYDEAHAALDRALEIRTTKFGTEHPTVAETLHIRGDLLFRQGRYADALAVRERSLRIWQKALGAEHPYVAMALVGRAEILGAMGRAAAARSDLERAIRIQNKALGATSVHLVPALLRLADVLLKLGKTGEAVAALDRVAPLVPRAEPARAAEFRELLRKSAGARPDSRVAGAPHGTIERRDAP